MERHNQEETSCPKCGLPGFKEYGHPDPRGFTNVCAVCGVFPVKHLRVLDHGYVRLVETWGGGDACVPEAGIIEAARQSTQGSFRGWGQYRCKNCGAVYALKQLHKDKGVDCIATCQEGDWEWLSNDSGLLAYLFGATPPHSTPFEFAGMIIEIQAPIAVFREWHRHRTQWYNEMSARYGPIPNFNYMPTLERLFATDPKNKQAQGIEGALELTEDRGLAWLQTVEALYQFAEDVYQRGLRSGVPKEIARMVLPVGRYSRMRAGTNLRNWLAFMTLRDHPAAQWEIRQFASAVGEILRQEFPRVMRLFDAKREGQ